MSFSKKIGSGIVLVIIFLMIYLRGYFKQKRLEDNALFTKGESLGIKSRSRGSKYLYYSFQIDGQYYQGSVSSNFCNRCSCCNIGDTVIVRYEEGDPENNDLVLKIPQ